MAPEPGTDSAGDRKALLDLPLLATCLLVIGASLVLKPMLVKGT